MKKMFNALCIVAGIGIACSINLTMDQEGTELTGLALTQVEALAQAEAGDNRGKCKMTGSLDCPYGSVKVRYVD